MTAVFRHAGLQETDKLRGGVLFGDAGGADAGREAFFACVSRRMAAVATIAFRDGLAASLQDEDSSFVCQIYAAGLLVYGDLSMVEVMLDHRPRGVFPGSATGYCIAAGSTVLSAMLPLPESLLTHGRDVVNESAVRTWFHTERDRLYFNYLDRRYHFRSNN